MEDLLARRAAVHAPFRLPSPLQRYRAQPGRHRVVADLVLTADGSAGPEGNTALVLGPESPAHVLAQADEFFAGAAYSVTVEVEVAAAMEEALRARGWQLDEEEPALLLSPIPAPPKAPAGLTISPVTTETAFEQFLALSRTPRRWIPSLSAALDGNVALLIGAVAAGPVAVARLTCFGQVGEILGVVTQPAYQRQGFGRALTWAAIAEAARRGCTAITLTATASGYRLYRHLGFVPVATYRTYLPPARP